MQPLFRLCLIGLMLVSPTLCQAFTVSGSYSSSEGAMNLQQQGDRVSGSYAKDNGELIGLMFDNLFEGFWIEDHSDRRCSTPKHGRYHWGRLTLSFTSNGFNGNWGYCNDPPSRPWGGSRTSGGPQHQPPPPPPTNDYDPFAGTHNDYNLTGQWHSSEGEISFQQHDNRVAGQYATDNGELMGTLSNSVLRGYWIEDHSAQRCSTPKNGRYFWGRIEFHFTGNRFSGKWGYCDGQLTGNWSGERR